MRKTYLVGVFFLVVILVGLLVFSNKNIVMAQGQGQNQGNIFGSHYQKLTFTLNSAVDTTIALPVSNEPVFVMASFSNITGPGGRVTATGLVVYDIFIYDSSTNTTHGTIPATTPRNSYDQADWSTGGFLIALLNPSSGNTFTLSLSSSLNTTNEITHAALTVTVFH